MFGAFCRFEVRKCCPSSQPEKDDNDKADLLGDFPPGQVKAPILQATMIEQHVVAVAQIIAHTLLCTAEQNSLTPAW